MACSRRRHQPSLFPDRRLNDFTHHQRESYETQCRWIIRNLNQERWLAAARALPKDARKAPITQGIV